MDIFPLPETDHQRVLRLKMHAWCIRYDFVSFLGYLNGLFSGAKWLLVSGRAMEIMGSLGPVDTHGELPPFCCHKAFGDMAPSSSPHACIVQPMHGRVPTISLTESNRKKNKKSIKSNVQNVTLPRIFGPSQCVLKKNTMSPEKEKTFEPCSVFGRRSNPPNKKKQKQETWGSLFFGSRIPFS